MQGSGQKVQIQRRKEEEKDGLGAYIQQQDKKVSRGQKLLFTITCTGYRKWSLSGLPRALRMTVVIWPCLCDTGIHAGAAEF